MCRTGPTHGPDGRPRSRALVAIGALLAAAEAGLCVPEDVSIMGYDDEPELADEVALSTYVDQCWSTSASRPRPSTPTPSSSSQRTPCERAQTVTYPGTDRPVRRWVRHDAGAVVVGTAGLVAPAVRTRSTRSISTPWSLIARTLIVAF